jgi:hypothetical protein
MVQYHVPVEYLKSEVLKYDSRPVASNGCRDKWFLPFIKVAAAREREREKSGDNKSGDNKTLDFSREIIYDGHEELWDWIGLDEPTSRGNPTRTGLVLRTQF